LSKLQETESCLERSKNETEQTKTALEEVTKERDAKVELLQQHKQLISSLEQAKARLKD
jgi:hypothetical protein